jgi:hypothetical protein
LRNVTRFLSLLFLFMTAGCGYRLGRGEIIEQYSSVCIPYVEGDTDGNLTTALIRQMTTKGVLAYRNVGADLLLQVCLLEPVDENIDFAYAPREMDGKKVKILVSNEARLTLTARISLIDRFTGECVLGPMNLSSWIDFDFEPDLSNIGFHAFALGQLEMHNLAQDAAFHPLYALLAEKIVDYVNHSW